jgi:hypothetical protein
MVSPIVRRTLEGLLSDHSGKQSPAASAAKNLEANDRATLLEMLGSHLTRKPDDKAGYDAFRVLLEHEVPDSLDVFSVVVSKVPPTRVPPAVGPDLRTLSRGKPVVEEALRPVLAAWERSDSKVGRALKPAKGGR